MAQTKAVTAEDMRKLSSKLHKFEVSGLNIYCSDESLTPFLLSLQYFVKTKSENTQLYLI